MGKGGLVIECYDAMNNGILQASGDVIGIINNDDGYEIDAAEKIAK